MSYPQKASAEELWAKYSETKSIWKTAEHFGMAGQSVHERLVKNGYRLHGSKFSKEDDQLIAEAYAMSPDVRNLNLKELTVKLDRSHHTNVARRARQLGLTNSKRTHTASQKVANSMKKLEALKNGKLNRTYANISKGWFISARGDRYFLKSGWELKYAQYLEMLLKTKAIKTWSYEPDTFWFEKIRRGVRSYTPDFKVTHTDDSIEYHEVKGWLDPASKTKLKRMRIYHPKVTVILMDKQALKGIGLI